MLLVLTWFWIESSIWVSVVVNLQGSMNVAALDKKNMSFIIMEVYCRRLV